MPQTDFAAGALRMASEQILQASCVAIDGRAVVIAGQSGAGKSTLALALIDRGAQLIGDDGVALALAGSIVIASPPPNITGKLEIRGVGLVELATMHAPVCLIVDLDETGERLPDPVRQKSLLGAAIPCLAMGGSDAASLPLRVEWGLRMHGLPQESL